MTVCLELMGGILICTAAVSAHTAVQYTAVPLARHFSKRTLRGKPSKVLWFCCAYICET